MSDLISALETADDPLLVTHHQADRDSLGAAMGLQALLGCGTLCTPDGIASPAQSLLTLTAQTPVTAPDEAAYDTIVVLDTPSSDRIAPVDPPAPLLVDHHEPSDLSERAAATMVDTDAGATAELVARLAETADWTLSPDAALPLLVGILDDTGFLAAASPATVTTAVRVIGTLGDRASDLPEFLDRSPSPGERMAKVLGVLRARGYRAGEIVIAVSRVGGHESAAARALRSAGVDLAVVCSQQEDQLRVSTRASTQFAERMNLGALLLPSLAAEFGGDGGGHAGAGVAHLESGNLDAVKAFLLAKLERELGMTFSEISI